jgi:hypothetical protein
VFSETWKRSGLTLLSKHLLSTVLRRSYKHQKKKSGANFLRSNSFSFR